MAYLHERGIAHRDIKLDNLLVTENLDPKVIDFGFSMKTKEGTRLKDYCGTPAYIGPEVLKRKPYLPNPCDVWAFGVLCFKMVAGFFPFSGTYTSDF